MKKIIFTLSVIMVAMGAFAQNAQKAKSEVLTVKEIRIERDDTQVATSMEQLLPRIVNIRWVDEKGGEGNFRYGTGKWLDNTTFENITSTLVTLPEKYAVLPRINAAGNIELVLADTEKLKFEFKVADEVQVVSIGTGTQFVVKRSKDGKITLLLPETAELAAAASSENN